MDEISRLDLWLANYTNSTPVSKDVMARTKDTYKGDAYLPWANMLGALYRLDPYAKVEKVMNENGGYVFTDRNILETRADVVKDDKADTKYNLQTFMAHMVKVRVTYLDKEFEEVYPIQDNKYEAVTRYDANTVNKALQRCMARTISLATGIGWKLYEQGEPGQFEEDSDALVPSGNVTTEIVPEAVEEDGRAFTVAEQVAHLIVKNKDDAKLINLVENYNTVLSKKYTYGDEPLMLGLDDDEVVLVEKLKVVDNIEKIWKGVSKVVS